MHVDRVSTDAATSATSFQVSGFEDALVGESPVLQTVFVGIRLVAAVNDQGFREWSTHRPVEPAVLGEIRDRPIVEFTLETVSPDVEHQGFEELGVNAIPNKVFVRPFRHGLGVGPFLPIDKGPQITGKS